MAGKFEGLARKPSGGGGYQGPREEGLVFSVVRYVVGNPNKADWANDYIEGALLGDRLGMTATYDENGVPTTTIKVYLGEPKPPKDGSKPTFSRPEVVDKKKGKGMAAAVKPGGMIRADGAKLDPSKGPNAVVCNWLNTLAPTYDPTTMCPVTGMQILVSREQPAREQQGSRESKPYQGNTIINGGGAVAFRGLDEFKTAAAEAIASTDQHGEMPAMPGEAGFVVRLVDLEEKTGFTRAFFKGWNSAEGRPATPEEMVARFLDEEPEFAAAIAAADPTAFFEVVPASRVETGSLSLPSAIAENRRKPKPGETLPPLTRKEIDKYDEGVNNCRFPLMADGALKVNEKGMHEYRYGYVVADLFAQRKFTPQEDRTPENPAAYSKWFRTDFSPVRRFGEIFHPDEFITDALPPEVKAKFVENAKNNSKAVGMEKKAAKEAPAPEEEHHVAGMTP